MFDHIIEVVSREFGISRDALLSPTRGSPDAAWARQVAMYLDFRLDKLESRSWAATGRRFNRDPTTVRYAFYLVDAWRDHDDFDATIERLSSVCAAASV